ncbi:uncharacterized protein VTP21DRAFT_1152 [Calcarisporiella thermophila]|uniref:uncharacterized protein n=1 Tax=Calcarisporiella thermophila TaxID=911321 RepID=UPI0037421B11
MRINISSLLLICLLSAIVQANGLEKRQGSISKGGDVTAPPGSSEGPTKPPTSPPPSPPTSSDPPSSSNPPSSSDPPSSSSVPPSSSSKPPEPSSSSQPTPSTTPPPEPSTTAPPTSHSTLTSTTTKNIQSSSTTMVPPSDPTSSSRASSPSASVMPETDQGGGTNTRTIIIAVSTVGGVIVLGAIAFVTTKFLTRRSKSGWDEEEVSTSRFSSVPGGNDFFKQTLNQYHQRTH